MVEYDTLGTLLSLDLWSTELPQIYWSNQRRRPVKGDRDELLRGDRREMCAVPKDVVRPVGAELALRGAYQHGIVVPESTARRFHFSKAYHQITGDEISTELDYYIANASSIG